MRGLALALLVACSSKPTTSSPGSGTAVVPVVVTDAAIAGPPTDTGAVAKQGEDCTWASCDTGLACVRWTTEGGEPHSTCEIKCGPQPDYACPPGTGCVHQGGGPSEVCLKR